MSAIDERSRAVVIDQRQAFGPVRRTLTSAAISGGTFAAEHNWCSRLVNEPEIAKKRNALPAVRHEVPIEQPHETDPEPQGWAIPAWLQIQCSEMDLGMSYSRHRVLY